MLRRGREESTVMFVQNKEQKCEGKGTERDQCDTVSHQPVVGCTITDANGHERTLARPAVRRTSIVSPKRDSVSTEVLRKETAQIP